MFFCEFCKDFQINFLTECALIRSPAQKFSIAELYQSLIWDYKKADTFSIRKDLQKNFSHKNIKAQITVFNETILNIFRNYVPNKYIICDDKDPVRLNENIKSKIKSLNIFYKTILITELNELINSTKALFHENLGKKMNNPLLQVKTHWFILKTF